MAYKNRLGISYLNKATRRGRLLRQALGPTTRKVTRSKVAFIK